MHECTNAPCHHIAPSPQHAEDIPGAHLSAVIIAAQSIGGVQVHGIHDEVHPFPGIPWQGKRLSY